MLLHRGLTHTKSAFLAASSKTAPFCFCLHLSFEAPESPDLDFLLFGTFTGFRRNPGVFASRNNDFNSCVPRVATIFPDGFFDVLGG